MQIHFFNLNKNTFHTPHPQNLQNRVATPRLIPLVKDTISFGSMKKAQFDAIDIAVIEKFKAPIEKFNTNNDLQKWSALQLKKIIQTDFGGRKEETKIQRKAMVKEWTNYILKENEAYNNAAALLILTALTKDLKPDNDKLPPVLNKGVLADCISEIENNIKSNKKYQFDLNKMYEIKLRGLYIEDTNTGETDSKWVVIPSKKHDPKNFDANVEKLKTLSHKTWCTKSFNAEPYLKEGDFHVYLENGQPKLGVRFVKNRIQEIQGEKNNSKIPIPYLYEIKKHISKNRLKLSDKAKKEIVEAEETKTEAEQIQHDLKKAIKNKDAKTIFEYFGMQPKEDADGFLTILEYGPILDYCTYSDIGIDEKWLFNKVKAITLKAVFEGSTIECLGNLESIGGDVDFGNSQVKSFGNLKSIGGNAYFQDSQIKSLGNLKKIDGYADFENSQVKSLNKLESIGGNVNFENSQVENLDNLKSIGGNAYFQNSQIKSLGNLKSIGGDADFENSGIESLQNLEKIGGYANFMYSQVKSLGNLKSIGGKVFLKKCLLGKESKTKLKAIQNEKLK